jgi:hypothetical protein
MHKKRVGGSYSGVVVCVIVCVIVYPSVQNNTINIYINNAYLQHTHAFPLGLGLALGFCFLQQLAGLGGCLTFFVLGTDGQRKGDATVCNAHLLSGHAMIRAEGV